MASCHTQVKGSGGHAGPAHRLPVSQLPGCRVSMTVPPSLSIQPQQSLAGFLVSGPQTFSQISALSSSLTPVDLPSGARRLQGTSKNKTLDNPQGRFGKVGGSMPYLSLYWFGSL